MRVLHVIDHIYPQLGYQEFFLAKAHSCVNPTLVISSDRYAKAIFEANKPILKEEIVGSGLRKEEGLLILRLPAWFNIPELNSPWLIGLEREITKFNPDLIIAHGLVNLSSIRIALAKRKYNKAKLVFDDHMTFNATRGGWTLLLYKIFKLLLAPIFIKSTDFFVAVTPETKNFMSKYYGIPKDSIKVIPLGYSEQNFFKDSQLRASIRKKHNIKDSEIVLIYAGKIVPEKGVHILVKAAIELCQKYDNLRFILIGGNDPDYLQRLKNQISIARLEGNFIILDAVPNKELCQYYNAADIGVWPLQCSVTMLEATACGLPTIISDKSGATDRIASGNGLLYRESDCSDLVEKIEMLLDSSSRASLSMKAVDYSQRICWKNLAVEFEKLGHPST